jgi:hypothetical protein
MLETRVHSQAAFPTTQLRAGPTTPPKHTLSFQMDSPVKLPSASQASVPAGSLRADPSSLADAILDVLYLSDEYIVVNKVRFGAVLAAMAFAG